MKDLIETPNSCPPTNPYTYKLDNLDTISEVLDRHKLIKLTHEELDNWKILYPLKKTSLCFKIFPQAENPSTKKSLSWSPASVSYFLVL